MPELTPSQKTIARPASMRGTSLFLSQPCSVTFIPAPADHGIVFSRSDLGGARIPALIANLSKRPRRTALRQGEAVVETTEHCLSAIAGLGIDNLLIEIDAPELPGGDGSAKPFVDVLQQAGLRDCAAPRRIMTITEPVMVRQNGATLAAMPLTLASPSEPLGLQILFEVHYRNNPEIGRQLASFTLGQDDYLGQISSARTFVLESEVAGLRAMGLGMHLTPADLLVIGPNGPLSPNAFRFSDEPVRHKILDLIGDLSLLGASIHGRIIASKSGHALNQTLVKALDRQLRFQSRQALATSRPVFDVRRLTTLLPHRYPMLLVDRVVEIDAERRVLGIKNVTMNEPFFQGHFPGTPIMPGVLVVEALAQLSGVLLTQHLDITGKIAVLMSLDRVKLRKPVVPGDQLILEAETVRVRGSLAHTRCRAYVGQDLAAEAEIKFIIVDAKDV